MRVKNLLKGLLLVPFACMGVCLDGFWQAKTQDVSAAYLSGYSFKGNQFAFCTSEYESFNPIFSLRGTYEICGDSIIFQPQYVERYSIKRVDRDPFILIDAWYFSDGEYVVDSLQNQEPIGADFKLVSDSLFMVDLDSFYRIEGKKPKMTHEDR